MTAVDTAFNLRTGHTGGVPSELGMNAPPGAVPSASSDLDDLPPDAGTDIYFPNREYKTVSVASDAGGRVTCYVIGSCNIDGQCYEQLALPSSVARWGRMHADSVYYHVRHRTRPGNKVSFRTYERINSTYGRYQLVVDTIEANMLAELEAESPVLYARWLSRYGPTTRPVRVTSEPPQAWRDPDIDPCTGLTTEHLRYSSG